MQYFKHLVILSVFATLPIFCFAQKFMIVDGDTLPYHEKLLIQTDTFYIGNQTYFPGDTLYEGNCETFERINNKVVNQSDRMCRRQGAWLITDSLGNYWSGHYLDNNRIGIWQEFDKDGKLLQETEDVCFARNIYRVKEIDYSSGKPVTIIDKPFLAFYIKNLIAIGVVFFCSFFGRIFVNSRIYNSEKKTDFSPIYLSFPGYLPQNFEHSLFCAFTLWFLNFKPECRRLAIVSNVMSAIAITIFLGVIIGLAVSGEI